MASEEAISQKTETGNHGVQNKAIPNHDGNGTSSAQQVLLQNQQAEHLLSSNSAQPPRQLTFLPYDIFYTIFTQSSLCSITCLGLTNKLFYSYLKLLHPAPIPLPSTVEFIPSRPHPKEYTCWMSNSRIPDDYGQNCIRGPRKLGALLRDFMGERYRLWKFYGTYIFLSVEKYGLPTAIRKPEKVKVLREEIKKKYKKDNILTHPFGLKPAQDDLEELLLLVMEDSGRHGAWSKEDVLKWRDFVERSYVPTQKRHFRLSEEIKDEWRWALFGEGIRMLEL